MLAALSKPITLLVIGALVATAGVGAHRAFGGWGVVISLAAVITGGVFARAWARMAGFVAFAAGWTVMTIIYAQAGPLDSVLIGQGVSGYAWIFGGSFLLGLIAVLPRRWIEGRDVAA